MWTTCPRCRKQVQDRDYAGPCALCVQDLRDDAAIAGDTIASRFDPAADHRSPGERRRED